MKTWNKILERIYHSELTVVFFICVWIIGVGVVINSLLLV